MKASTRACPPIRRSNAAQRTPGGHSQRCLLSDGLRAVLAELREFASAVLFGPGATGAVESIALVESAPRLGSPDQPHLPESALRRNQDRPQPGGSGLGSADERRVFVVLHTNVTVGTAALLAHRLNLWQNAEGTVSRLVPGRNSAFGSSVSG